MEVNGCASRSHAKPIPLLRLAIALVALALASLLALATSAEPAWAKDGTFGGGDGSSEDNAILIEDEADMVAFASLNDSDISSGYGNELDASKSKYGKFFKLTADLDMTADAYKSAFHPVGLLEFDSYGSTVVGFVAFNGTFDGDGHTVKVGLESKNATFLGLFPLVRGTSVSPAVVKNLVVEGRVSAKSSSASGVGGICGKASFATFSQCANSAAVSGRQHVGGILGKQESAKKPVTIEQSRNSGAIASTRASGDSYAGGIAGQLSSGTADKASEIASCYNVGAVSVGGGNYAGGIAGQLQGGTLASDGESRMENCYSSGTVTGNYTGGLMGIPSMANSSANVYKTYLKNSFSTVSPIVSEKMKQFGNEASTAGRYTYRDASGAVADIATGVVADLSTEEFLAAINNGGNAFVKGETSPVLAWEQGGSQPEPEPEGDLIIHDKAEFLAFANAVNGGETYEGKVVALAADIDMADEQTYPIGYKSSNYIEKNWFMGTFDGNGHAITGVNVVAHPNSRVAGGNVGLFGYVKGASSTTPTVIKNFTVSGKVQGAGEYVGGVVGNVNSASIENVGSSVVVESTKAGAATVGCQVGGLVGGVSGMLNVDGCYARGAVVASDGTAVGGLIGGVGRIDEQSGYDGNICKATVSNSYSTAAVYASDYAGGLIGVVTQNKDKAFSNVVMTNCYAASSISSTGSATGSFLGLTSSGATGTNLFADSDAASGLNPVGEIASYQVIGYPNPGPKVDGEDLITASVESMSAASMGTADFAARLGDAFKVEFPAANGSHPALKWESADSAAPVDISSYALSAQGGYLEGDGSAFAPAIEVKAANSDTALDSAYYGVRYFSDEACTIAVPANGLDKPGTYYAKAYGNAGLGYVGATQAVPFELIARTVIDNSDVSSIPVQTYTGSAIAPELAVVVDGKTLSPETDYTVLFENNTNVGTAKAIISGKGAYAGRVEAEFEIISADVSSLQEALNVAEASAAKTVVSEDGADVYEGTYWTSKEARDEFDTAVATARAALAKTPSTEADVASAVTALNGAAETFEAARQQGTLPIPEPAPGPAPSPQQFAVTYHLDGGVNAASNPATFAAGTEVALAAPTKEGYEFAGWYADASFKTAVTSIPATANADVELYAKWAKKAAPAPTFPDVDYSESSWYGEAVTYVAGKGLITGYASGDKAGMFGVGDALTRAQLATILWRNACPEEAASYDAASAKDTTGIAGSADGQYYTAAANWAVKNGVISGFVREDGTKDFAADEAVSFEQLVTIVARLCAAPGELASAGSDLSVFVDGADASDWSRSAFAWAAGKGLVEGYDTPTGKLLSPGEDVARERVAVVLMRAFEMGVLK